MSADQIPGGEEARSRRRVLAVDRDVRPGEREHATLEELLDERHVTLRALHEQIGRASCRERVCSTV